MVPPFHTKPSSEQMFSKRALAQTESVRSVRSQSTNTFHQNNNNGMKRIKLEDNSISGATNGFAGMSQCDDGYDDNIEELLNDENTDNYCSQVCDKFMANNTINGLNNNLTRISNHGIMSIDNEEIVINEDVTISTNLDQTLDATQGRNKILESRLNKLEEELRQQKALHIRSQKQRQEMKEEYERKIRDMKHQSDSIQAFRDNENRNNCRKITELQEIIETITKGKSPGIKVEFAKDFMRQRQSCPNFSQQKLQEFYAPISTSTTVNTQLTTSTYSPNSILVPETQNSYSTQTVRCQTLPQPSNHFKHPSSIQSTRLGLNPSEIAPTQEVSSRESISQSQNPKWESFRSKMEAKFRSNRQSLKSCYINEQLVDLFPDDWLRVSPDVILWSQSLTEESNGCDLKVVKFECLHRFQK